MGRMTISIFIVLLYLSIFTISGTCSSNINMKYGYWPFYVDGNTYQPDWSKLDTVVYFFSDCDSNGNVYQPRNYENYLNVKNQTQKHGKKLELAIWSADPVVIDTILAYHSDEFADNIVTMLQKEGAEGVILDLEYPEYYNSVTGELNAPLIESFIQKLDEKLNAANPDYELGIAIGWASDLVPQMSSAKLNEHVDKVIFMAYDYHGYVGAKSGANSPFNDPKNWDVADSVNYITQYYDKDKIIVKLPFYCYDSVTSSGLKGSTVKSLKSIPLTKAISNSKYYNVTWDSASNTPWYKYQKNGKWHQVWFDNYSSLKLKADFAKSAKLGGIGYYPLGSEPKEIWSIFV